MLLPVSSHIGLDSYMSAVKRYLNNLKQEKHSKNLNQLWYLGNSLSFLSLHPNRKPRWQTHVRLRFGPDAASLLGLEALGEQ